MKPLKDAFTESINRAEQTLNRKKSGGVNATAKNCGHAITKLSLKRNKKRKLEAYNFVQQARHMGLDTDTLAKIDAAAKAHTQSSETWIFVMLSAQQNAEVVQWINRNSKRPQKAGELWAILLTHLRMDTGEIMQTRQQLAERVHIEPRDLSSIMTELASINAIRREKDGRRVKYFINPNIATHLPNVVSRAKAREESGPLMQVIEGGRPVDDDAHVIDE